MIAVFNFFSNPFSWSLPYAKKDMEYCEIMKKVVANINKSGSRVPTCNLVINKNDVTSQIGIANEFNKFFINKHWSRVGQKNLNCIGNISELFK